MTSVLDRQLDALGESAAELRRAESVGPSTVAVEVGELVAFLVEIADRLHSLCSRIDHRITSGQIPYDLVQAMEVWRRFVRLDQLMREAIALARACETAGFAVEGIDRLKAAEVEVGKIASVSPEHEAAADESIRQGRVRKLDEVRDELRRRVGA